jgi:hypothetical protein
MFDQTNEAMSKQFSTLAEVQLIFFYVYYLHNRYLSGHIVAFTEEKRE